MCQTTYGTQQIGSTSIKVTNQVSYLRLLWMRDMAKKPGWGAFLAGITCAVSAGALILWPFAIAYHRFKKKTTWKAAVGRGLYSALLWSLYTILGTIALLLLLMGAAILLMMPGGSSGPYGMGTGNPDGTLTVTESEYWSLKAMGF